MRKQSEGLTKEYDRLLEEHTKLQVSTSCPALLAWRVPLPLAPPSQSQCRPVPSWAASAEPRGNPHCAGEADTLLLQVL